jgi:hypothetical protein
MNGIAPNETAPPPVEAVSPPEKAARDEKVLVVERAEHGPLNLTPDERKHAVALFRQVLAELGR